MTLVPTVKNPIMYIGLEGAVEYEILHLHLARDEAYNSSRIVSLSITIRRRMEYHLQNTFLLVRQDYYFIALTKPHIAEPDINTGYHDFFWPQ